MKDKTPFRSTAFYHSEIGPIKIRAGKKGIESVVFQPKGKLCPSSPHPVLRKALRQLDEYFGGRRKRFSVPLSCRGTAFQKSIWRQIRQIPFGNTRSYRDLACQARKPRALRAVGQAVARNPLALLIPCHRVIRHSGELGGFAWGTRRKARLLEHERADLGEG